MSKQQENKIPTIQLLKTPKIEVKQEQKVRENKEKKMENYKTEEKKPNKIKEEKSNLVKDSKRREQSQDFSLNSTRNQKVNNSVDIPNRNHQKDFFTKDKVEISFNKDPKSKAKIIKTVEVNPMSKENKENILRTSNDKISKIIPKNNYNTNNSIIRKSLNLIKKSPIKNESKENKTSKMPFNLKKENFRKSSIGQVEKHTSKLQSIEINLNCEIESFKNKLIPIQNEDNIHENLQKDENKDICLSLEDLKLPTGYHIDSQGNQRIELLNEINDEKLYTEENKNENNISITS